MNNEFFEWMDDTDRVDGLAKVTGKAQFAAEHPQQGLLYAVLVSSTISKGSVSAINTTAAKNLPGVKAIIGHGNAPEVPGYKSAQPNSRTGLKIFQSPEVMFYGQPVAMVVADSFERATYAASKISVSYNRESGNVNFAHMPESSAPRTGGRGGENGRGDKDAWQKGEVKHEAEYIQPINVHHPMELHAITARWDSPEKITVWDKTQGPKSTQKSIMAAFGLKEENVQVYAPFVGGGFGSALRVWPHEIAALMAAKQTNAPVKLVLTRPQMSYLVGYRPYTLQRIGLSASKDGKLTGMMHEAHAITSSYEDFTEGPESVSRALYACPNVLTRYHIYPFNVSTPTWMRGPGEATGAFALESAMDELAYKLNVDPIQLRLVNYAETDPEKNRPFSSKFLKEAMQMGADAIGWNDRKSAPGSVKDGPWLLGMGMACGMFNAGRGTAKVRAQLAADGKLVLQSAVSDSGPGTSTAMSRIAMEQLGIPMNMIRFELGDTSLPPGPTQGGSTTTSTLGSAVHLACQQLKEELVKMAKSQNMLHTEKIHDFAATDVKFEKGMMTLIADPSAKVTYQELFRKAGRADINVEQNSGPDERMKNFSAYSYSVHFVRVRVHSLTGVVKVDKIVTAADAGKIVSPKTARSQMVGGAVGGIGMALTEELIFDKQGIPATASFADYHVPVHADIPAIETRFVDKPDPILNPMGSKGMGEIALIGMAAAVCNAVFNATGKRIREIPITPDKVLMTPAGA